MARKGGIALAQPPPTPRTAHRSPSAGQPVGPSPSRAHQSSRQGAHRARTAPPQKAQRCAGKHVFVTNVGTGEQQTGFVGRLQDAKTTQRNAAGAQWGIHLGPARGRATRRGDGGRGSQPARSWRRGDLPLCPTVSDNRQWQAATVRAESDSQHEAQRESNAHQHSSSSKQSQKKTPTQLRPVCTLSKYPRRPGGRATDLCRAYRVTGRLTWAAAWPPPQGCVCIRSVGGQDRLPPPPPPPPFRRLHPHAPPPRAADRRRRAAAASTAPRRRAAERRAAAAPPPP